MYTHESFGESGYIYFPIEYPNNALVVLVTLSSPFEDLSAWIQCIDKAKFLDGFGNDWIGSTNKQLYLISLGF